jgi:probable HAF family extracellular repeat protein
MFRLMHHSVLGRAGFAAVVLALAVVAPAQARAKYPYTLVDPGTFGGPQSELNLPAIPVTPQGMLLGSADTTIPDKDYPNVNPFTVLFPDQDVAHAFAWQNGQLQDLGALPGNNSSAVFEVNSCGVGVGMSENGGTDPFTGWPTVHATTFSDGQVSDMGALPGGQESFAIAINDRGQATGMSSDGTPDPFSFFGWGTETRGFVWQHGAMHDLGTLGGADTVVNNLNQRGQIAGWSYTNGTANPATGHPTTDPFLWQNGHMRDLGTLGGTYGLANWLNNRGEVVGYSYLALDKTFHPFLWDGNRMTDLGTLGGDLGQANSVNERGDVAGWAALAGDQTLHAVLWTNGKMLDLPPVSGAPWSFANSVNDQDQVVGNVTDTNGNELDAALWSGRNAYDLNTLIAPSALHLVSAEYVNDQDQIVGQGVLPDGSHRVFLLIRNPSVALPATTASVARARRGERTRHHRPTDPRARRLILIREFGPAARIGRRPTL